MRENEGNENEKGGSRCKGKEGKEVELYLLHTFLWHYFLQWIDETTQELAARNNQQPHATSTISCAQLLVRACCALLRTRGEEGRPGLLVDPES